MHVGINDTIFERDEAETTRNMEKEEIDAWISGADVAKSSVKESTERRAGCSEGILTHDEKLIFLTLRVLNLLDILI